MGRVSSEEKEKFFQDVAEASAKAQWCALATVKNGEPRVRIVHPTWDGDVLWFATGKGTPKLQQIEAHANVDVQFQISPPQFVHILAQGPARPVTDLDEKKRVWDVIDYDLGMFWKGGPEDPDYVPVRIDPVRVELSLMFGTQQKRVWVP